MPTRWLLALSGGVVVHDQRDWRTDLSDSAFEFDRVVWPRIKSFCGGGDMMPVESVTADGVIRQLDVLAGIDVLQIHGEHGIRGIASRVQWNDSRPGFPYRTFTIRKTRSSGASTEYKKRAKALNDAGGWFCPHLTCQAYCTLPKREGELVAVAVAETRHVIDAISSGDRQVNETSNADFWVVSWDDMRRLGFKVLEWPKPSIAPNENEINWG